MRRGSWALWHREVILEQDGVTPYLTRRRLFMTPWVSLYFHRLHRPDFDRVLHDHPAVFISLIVSGGYIEEWAKIKPGVPFDGHRTTSARGRFRVTYIGKDKAHRIGIVAPNTKTLVLLGPRKNGDDAWGFWLPGATEHVPWREYLRSINHPQSEKS
jgi:hypothetical protein